MTSTNRPSKVEPPPPRPRYDIPKFGKAPATSQLKTDIVLAVVDILHTHSHPDRTHIQQAHHQPHIHTAAVAVASPNRVVAGSTIAGQSLDDFDNEDAAAGDEDDDEG